MIDNPCNEGSFGTWYDETNLLSPDQIKNCSEVVDLYLLPALYIIFCFEKRLDVALKHALGVVDFNVGAVIFNEFVRVEHVGADL
jgi:hypothetical protein